ncbi:MAG: helix-turn-helix domain-containing protein [Armatimonadota bacterium]|nr:helix-turn-helix domain-containing protein [Armatimonadota bacterium]
MDDKRLYFKKVGSKIRQAREAVHMTGDQLGKAMSPAVGHAAITRWETGERRIPLDRLDQVAGATGQDLNFFFGQTHEDAESDLDRELLAAFDAMRHAGPDDKRRLIEIMRALRRAELGR